MGTKKICVVTLCVLCLFLLLYLLNGYFQNKLLFRAIECNNYDEAKSAIKHGAFINTRQHLLYIPEIAPTNPTPLISACKEGHQRIVELLLTNGADVNKADNYTGETPLIASLHGRKQNRFSLAFYLINCGANINITQNSNSAFQETLLVLETDTEETIQEGFRLFQYLMENNVDKTVYNSKENVLTYATHYRNYNVVNFLLENDYCEVNEIDGNGSTALITAAKYNQIDIVSLLLDYGADKSFTDFAGKSAYDYATANGFVSIVELLKGGQGDGSG